MKQPLVQIVQLNLQYADQVVLSDFNWTIYAGENWVIGGKSGTGKTSLAKTIAEDKHPAHVYYVSNWYQFTNLEGDRNFYYQQRYNKFHTNDTVSFYVDLFHFCQKLGLDLVAAVLILEAFVLQNCKDTQLIELSSGEYKKVLLVQGLWLRPKFLIIDEPFTGLDQQ